MMLRFASKVRVSIHSRPIKPGECSRTAVRINVKSFNPLPTNKAGRILLLEALMAESAFQSTPDQ